MNKLSNIDVTLVKPKINFADFDTLKQEAIEISEKIENINLTEENIKEVKKILAKTNKSIKELNDRRILIKKEVLKPYSKFEEQIKEIENIVKSSDERIRNHVKELEERERNHKKESIKEIWDKRIKLYDLAKIFEFKDWIESKHLNKSETMKKVEQDMVSFLEETERNLNVLIKMDYSDELIDYYKQTKDVGLSIQMLKDEKERIEKQKKITRKLEVGKEKKYVFIVQGDKDRRLVKLMLEEANINFKMEEI